MFKHAIVRTPCPEMIHGITSATLGKPDYSLALNQHKEYVETLRSLGLEITVLIPDSRFPDSTFVEDVALCAFGLSVITNPGAASRKGEEVDMERALGSFYDHIEHIESPGTVEAGDVMKSGMSYLENNNLLAQKEFLNHPALNRFRKIKVGANESYAANSLWVNGTVLVPSGFPVTRSNIEQSGYPTIALDVSEFEKLDGGLSCLSIRF